MKRLILSIVFLLVLSSKESRAQDQPTRPVQVEHEYLNDLDQGKQVDPIAISRKQGEQLELVLPNLHRTSVLIWDEENYSKYQKNTYPYQPIQTTGSSEAGERNAIVLHLSKLKDGTYYVRLTGDSAVGTFQVHLKTE